MIDQEEMRLSRVIDDLRADNEHLRALLKPFAEYADRRNLVRADFVITQGFDHG